VKQSSACIPVTHVLRSLCRLYGLPDVLQAPEGLLPGALLVPNQHSDHAQGVAAAVLEVYRILCELPEGRKAIADLGFQPFFQQVEGP